VSVHGSNIKRVPTDRDLLIAYLRYVLDELDRVNETSADLVRMAIQCLGEGAAAVPPQADGDVLCN
jgi:hypothetical protein